MTSRRTILGAGVAAWAPRPAAANAAALTLFELRNYATQPGRRDALIEMFEAQFLDAYEDAGASILGTFRNLDDPNRWVWIRAFADNASRASALNGFYASAAWRARRAQANATIVDVSDALLLSPMLGDLSLQSAKDTGPATVEIARYFPAPGNETQFHALFSREAAPVLTDLGAGALTALETARVPNAYPRLPLRDDAALVTVARFDNEAAYRDFRARLERAPRWAAFRDSAKAVLGSPVEVWRLQPTPRSFIR
jgi:hypothetical protein